MTGEGGSPGEGRQVGGVGCFLEELQHSKIWGKWGDGPYRRYDQTGTVFRLVTDLSFGPAYTYPR